MKNLLLILALTLTACGGSSVTEAINPFEQALGKTVPSQLIAPVPTDPFAPLLKKPGG